MKPIRKNFNFQDEQKFIKNLEKLKIFKQKLLTISINHNKNYPHHNHFITFIKSYYEMHFSSASVTE